MRRLSFLAAAAFIASVALAACAQGEQGATPEPEDTPALTLAPSVAVPQFAYIDSAGDMWLMKADGSDRWNLTEGNPLRCPRPMGIYWSPTGDWLACVGTGPGLTPQTNLVIVDPEGRPLLAMEVPKAYLDRFSWSPTGQGYAYVLALPDSTWEFDVESIGNCGLPGLSRGDVREFLWSPDGSQLAYRKGQGEALGIYDLASQQEKLVMDGLRPLAWVLGGKLLLVASDYKEGQGIYARYTVNLLDPATGELTRVLQLDNGAQFWPSPDGRTVAFFTHQEGAEIALLDLTTGAVTPIPGAVPSLREWIPPDHVTFSPDGSQLFWADLLPAPEEGVRSVAIYRANTDGSENKRVGQIESVEIRFSPDLTKVLYRGAGSDDESPLWLANIDGSDARLLAEDAWPVAWRPKPPSQPALAATPSAAELSAEQAIERALGILATDPQNRPDPATAKATRMTEREARALLARETGQWAAAPASDRPVWLVEIEGEFRGFKAGPPGPGNMLMIVCADGRGGGAGFLPDQ